jgi:hypothetical protein
VTEKQTAAYWRKWGRVRKILTTIGEFSAKDADAHRAEIHKEALGVAKSSKDLTNRDLDKIFAAFDAYLVIEDGPGAGDRADQPRKRLIWAIERLGLEGEYLARICQDQHKTTDWHNLPMDQLQKFRFTATARAAARNRAQKQP